MLLKCRYPDTAIDVSRHAASVVASLSKTLNQHCFSRLSCEMNTKQERPREVCLLSAVVPNLWVGTPNGVATPMPWGR